MTILYIAVGIILVVGIGFAFWRGGFEVTEEKAKYRYNRKNFFLTRAEHECYDALVEAVGTEYRIFAQVHLPTLVDHTVRGQDWRAALAHINRKSVDFVLCDRRIFHQNWLSSWMINRTSVRIGKNAIVK